MILPPKDAGKFFEIMLPMLSWVKSAKGVKAALKNSHADMNQPEQDAYALLNIVWKRPEFIDKYISEREATISAEARRNLSKWRKHYVPGPFFIERFTNKGAIFISAKDGQVYLVSGITSDIEESLDRNALPYVVETTLIPYRGRIVYDSTMKAKPKLLTPEGKQELARIYDAAKKNHNIIQMLPPKNPAEKNEQRELMVRSVMTALFEEAGSITRDELSRRLFDDPEVNLIPEKDLSVIEKLLCKPHRSQKDWDRIEEILFSGDVFTAEPMIESGSIKAVDHILCDDDVLFVFTTFDKCQKHIKRLGEKDPSLRYFEIGTLPYETAVAIADDNHLKLFLDYPENPLWEMFLAYESETRRLSATIAF